MNLEIPILKIVLLEPRIPQNTGCIARTAAALKLELILIEPLGFSLEDKYLKRAGLDYWPFVNISLYPDFSTYMSTLKKHERILACSKAGGINYRNFKYKNGDNILLGREDTGLPENIKAISDNIITIPMRARANNQGEGGVRSLNLSVSAGIITFEACSQLELI